MEKAVNIIIEGGIGDLILSLGVIESIRKKGIGIITIHTTFPEIARYFLGDFFYLYNGDMRECQIEKLKWDYYISISDFCFVHKKPDTKVPENFQKMYDRYREVFQDWGDFIKNHPHRGNEMAHKALLSGLTRRSMPFHFIGEHYQKFEIKNPPNQIKIPNKFITIHDGFDATGFYRFEKSMKSWEIEYWENLVQQFKMTFPDISVVQLGGVKHRKIRGVDINFAGHLSFEKTLEYLNSSLLHIDGDSGLVHARHLFKKRSIVLFGPTNKHYFGYEENTNIGPSFCGDCWWKKPDWMKNCVNGYSEPLCMQSIPFEKVFEFVLREIGLS